MSMKKIALLISAVAALALTSACNMKADFPEPASENAISIDLVYAAPGTRSDGTEKENKINSVDYFFYTDTTLAPVFKTRDENPSVTGNIYSINVVAGENGVPRVSQLFSNNNQFEVFAVFNSTEAITAAPLATLKQKAVGVTFAHQEDGQWVPTSDNDIAGNDKYFVMTGQKTVKRATSGSYANVQGDAKTVDMKRVAAKVSVKLYIKKQVEQSSTVHWIPMVDDPTLVPAIKGNVRMYMCNFVQNSILSATNPTPALPASLTQSDYKPYTLATGPDDRTETSTDYVIASQQDYYTYPIQWTPGSVTEPYIKLVLPWRMKEGFTTQKEVYYKILFPASITSIEANKHYQLEVNVSLLGIEGVPVVTVRGYNAKVLPWVSDQSVNSAVSNAKYLSVEKNSSKYFTQNNGISFVASDQVYLEITDVYQENLKTGAMEYIVEDGELTDQRDDLGARSFIMENGRIVGLTVGDGDKAEDWIKLSNTASFLETGHKLNANLASEHLDVTPWHYNVTMKLVGADATYDRAVTFEQWPNLYIDKDPNSNNGAANNVGVFVNNHQGGSNTYDKGKPNGTSWLGNQLYTNDGTFNLGNVSGLTGSNTNPNMYVITISVSDTYDIGDPRSKEENNFPDFYHATNWSTLNLGYLDTESNWASAPGIEGGGNRRLQHYHPAASDATLKNMIAPKIRIASSYGVSSALGSREEAQLRCASYQEDGIPAGRWRLPTLAEVKFISSLSALNRIPYLFANEEGTTGFNSTTYYWTASGQIAVNNGAHTAQEPTTQNGTAYVRCVYDEWFWGDAMTTRPVSNKRTFTWGDRAY